MSCLCNVAVTPGKQQPSIRIFCLVGCFRVCHLPCHFCKKVTLSLYLFFFFFNRLSSSTRAAPQPPPGSPPPTQTQTSMLYQRLKGLPRPKPSTVNFYPCFTQQLSSLVCFSVHFSSWNFASVWNTELRLGLSRLTLWVLTVKREHWFPNVHIFFSSLALSDICNIFKPQCQHKITLLHNILHDNFFYMLWASILLYEMFTKYIIVLVALPQCSS